MTENNHKTVLTGGCQCGAIRFALSKPPAKISICHCRMCQKASGAPFASFADIEHEAFHLDPRQAGRRSNPPPSPSAISAPPAARP